MKTLNLHATQTKKTYRRPVLKKMGDVKSITKGGTGGSSDELGVGKPA